MSEGAHLLIVLAILYISDCFFWLHHHSSVLVKGLRGGWEMRQTGRLLVNQNGRAVFLNPFPLLAPTFQVEPAAVSVSPHGVVGWISNATLTHGRPPQTGRMIPWDACDDIHAEDENVFVNGEKLARCHSKGRAKQLADNFHALSDVKIGDREALIRTQLVAELEEERIAGKVQLAAQASGSVRLLGRILFVALFVAAPLVTWQYGLLRTIVPVAAALFGCVVTTAVFYGLAHRKLFPARVADRVGHILVMCISWPMAIRASDALTRHILEGFHPLAVARHLMHEAAFRSYAETVLRDLHYPLAFDHLDAEAREVVDWHLACERAVIGEWLQDSVALTDPELESGEVSYCPRCRTAYTLESGECAACPGVSLLKSRNT